MKKPKEKSGVFYKSRISGRWIKAKSYLEAVMAVNFSGELKITGATLTGNLSMPINPKKLRKKR